MPRKQSSWPFTYDSGTVTAELAIAMPTVTLVIAVTLSAFGLQVERMNYVAAAASAARALGRGEAQVEVQALLAEIAPEASLEVEFLSNHVCTTVAKRVPVIGLQDFEISERQCARKMGL
jgi:hypothetical protein